MSTRWGALGGCNSLSAFHAHVINATCRFYPRRATQPPQQNTSLSKEQIKVLYLL